MTRGKRKWLETPTEVTTTSHIKEIPKRHKSALHGLVATCEDASQGTYMVQNAKGFHWLIAQGADGVFDIIHRPDQIQNVPSDGRIIAAVKTYKKRNERMR